MIDVRLHISFLSEANLEGLDTEDIDPTQLQSQGNSLDLNKKSSNIGDALAWLPKDVLCQHVSVHMM